MELVEHFEAARPRLMSLAYRIVGSHHDAEDAVQTAWTRAQTADMAQVTNPDGWLTTVTARLCLDQLRARQRRAELPLFSEDLDPVELAADEAFLRRENVSRALLVLLAELSPRQRVAYVLHDLFALPFDQVAPVLDTTPISAKKLASRARLRLRGARPADPGHHAEHAERTEHAEIVSAFLAAARGGDIARLVTLLAPDAVRTAHPRLLPADARAVVHGATAIAEETSAFADRIATAVPILVAGHPGAVIAPGGRPYAVIRFRVNGGRVRRIDITPYRSAVRSGAAGAGRAWS
ncbi:sigma-70 family RNA polymerase sigma factor [Streptomyces hainanensis]|uniref:Sigma-70 family RNA polymerase sigma factor n=1 Tax=Streptomyces hainanensis TaxID=402648 RepID=A0A4R4T5T4_9ACTN|nr:sigma-70 family RNA polymerase sigma factor [Streptomyces hainanensis]TDC72290.1 sigma-70 family RNA polymerase sigma factor [Streptomyces hainanensis]